MYGMYNIHCIYVYMDVCLGKNYLPYHCSILWSCNKYFDFDFTILCMPNPLAVISSSRRTGENQNI